MWEERYSSGELIYGSEPNEFFTEQIGRLKPGRILLPADGQGRNGIYAASQGWDVVSFDISNNAREKALEQAALRKLQINYIVAGWEDIDLPLQSFDAVAMIYAHTDDVEKKRFHHKMASFLKPGGTIILEAFSKEQLQFNSGGPKDVNMLYSDEELKQDFSVLTEANIQKLLITLGEGHLHKGMASVVRMQGRK